MQHPNQGRRWHHQLLHHSSGNTRHRAWPLYPRILEQLSHRGHKVCKSPCSKRVALLGSSDPWPALQSRCFPHPTESLWFIRIVSMLLVFKVLGAHRRPTCRLSLNGNNLKLYSENACPNPHVFHSHTVWALPANFPDPAASNPSLCRLFVWL